MTSAPAARYAPAFPLRSLQPLLDAPGTRTIVLAMSKDHDAKVSVLVVRPGEAVPQLAAKIATTPAAEAAVEREGRLLVELRRLGLRPVIGTIPRFVEMRQHDGRLVLVASAVPGVPLTRGYHSWRHTARPQLVAEDFRVAGDWLARLQDASLSAPSPVNLLAGAAERIVARADSTPERRAVAAEVAVRVARLHDRLSAFSTPRTVVHADFWFGNILVDPGQGGAVSGVVDWEQGSARGEPLRDIGRFAVSYSLYLDRHTPVGRPVPGHHGLRADHRCAGLRYALTRRSWYHDQVRAFLAGGLRRLGLPTSAWYDLGWGAVADVAATAVDDEFAWRHVELLAALPEPVGLRGRP
jgi:aminoglycoside phosphotransferase